MNEFGFSIPQNITVGRGTLGKLGEAAKKLGGTHAFIISGPHLDKMGLVARAEGYLEDAGIKADAYTDIEANPSVTTVERQQKLSGLQAQTLSWHSGEAHLWM